MTGFEILEKYLNLATQRQGLVVNNMANVDTPGFRTRDFDFRGELTRAMQGVGDPDKAPMSKEVQGLLARPDGNNVNLDRESLSLAESQVQFRIGVQLIRSEFKRLLTAINEGKSE